MSDVAELKFWACCSDAIDWSHDGIIAFASEENVEMLVRMVLERLTNAWSATRAYTCPSGFYVYKCDMIETLRVFYC
jgi:hypothetical protein